MATPSQQAPHRHVFLVDDDEFVLRTMRIVLAKHFKVSVCSHPTLAIGQIRAASPDLLVLDVKMPEHDGFWVFREVRKFMPLVPVVFNSAYQDFTPPIKISRRLRTSSVSTRS